MFNDVAVGIRRLQALGRIRRACIVDLDVHQGNGTNAVFAGDDSVYTFDMHGAKNFPSTRCPPRVTSRWTTAPMTPRTSTASRPRCPRPLRDAHPDLVVYLAGADPHER